MRRARRKRVSAGAMHANFMIRRMDSCFHGTLGPRFRSFDSIGFPQDSANGPFTTAGMDALQTASRMPALPLPVTAHFAVKSAKEALLPM
jgi:hypothetical protein